MFAQGTVLLDKYVVDRPIGHGGMATVFAATHLQLNEQVAIKCIVPELAQNATIVQRFLREARAAVRLRNEHVTRVLDVGVLPWGQPYMVMELLAGMDLAELLKARGMLAPHEAVDIVLQVCEALAEAHAVGIVHRDIKPSNLFITTRPDGSQLVKVLDFGISKVGFDNEVTDLTQQQILGTPSFMSPEQLRGLPTVDARSDIWSLGIVLYRLVGGQQPFKGDSMSALAIQCATEPTPILSVPMPSGLDKIVYRCLEKSPDHRYQSVAELAYALAAYAGDPRAAAIVIERTQNILRWTPPPVLPRAATPPLGEPTTLGSSAASYASPRPKQHRRGLVIGGVAAVLIGVSLAAITAIGGDTKSSDTAATTQPAPPAATPAVEATKPSVETTKPAVETTKPAIENTNPTETTKPSVEVAKPAVETPQKRIDTSKSDKSKPRTSRASRPKHEVAKPKAEPKAEKPEVAKPEVAKPEVEKKPDPPKPKPNPLDSRM